MTDQPIAVVPHPGPCTKCGEKGDHRIRYRPAKEFCPEYHPQEEHFDVTCRRCDYVWSEKVVTL